MAAEQHGTTFSLDSHNGTLPYVRWLDFIYTNSNLSARSKSFFSRRLILLITNGGGDARRLAILNDIQRLLVEAQQVARIVDVMDIREEVD